MNDMERQREIQASAEAPEGRTNASEAGFDEANKALVDALRFFFWVLKVFMIFFVGLYLFSGFYKVEKEDVALLVRFGKVVPRGEDVEIGPGLHVSFPWPIDRVIKIRKGTQRRVASEFWFTMTEEERARGPGPMAGASLVPGKDHYVITGDANILHLAVTVNYRIARAYDFVQSIEGADAQAPPGEIVQPEKDVIVALANDAMVRAAGHFTVDALLTQDRSRFTAMAEKYLRQSLDELNGGLTLDYVLISKIEPPRQVVRYFNDVRNAAEQKGSAIKQAQGDAEKLLRETARAGYQELIDAIALERKMRETNDPKLADAQERVARMLDQAGGSVEGILGEAKNYRTRLVESAKAEAEYFQALLPQFKENEQVVFTRLLLSTMEEVFERARKWYVPKNVKEVRFMVDRDPRELRQEIEEKQRTP